MHLIIACQKGTIGFVPSAPVPRDTVTATVA